MVRVCECLFLDSVFFFIDLLVCPGAKLQIITLSYCYKSNFVLVLSKMFWLSLHLHSIKVWGMAGHCLPLPIKNPAGILIRNLFNLLINLERIDIWQYYVQATKERKISNMYVIKTENFESWTGYIFPIIYNFNFA